MYPPRFDLRHFMSHLAPGGYYFLQLLLPAAFLLWLFFPEIIDGLGPKLNTVTGVLLTFGFLIFGVFCYFVGVVLRLPPVDEIDKESIENNVRLVLDDLKSEANGIARVAGRAVSRLFRQVFPSTLSPLTCRRALCVLKALQPIRLSDGCDLRLMSIDTADSLVNEGRDLVIVALVGTNLHIRIFDINGKRVVDKAENELIENELMSRETLTILKKQLNSLPDESGLSQEQKQKIIRDATSIAGHTLSGKIDKLVTALKKEIQDKPATANYWFRNWIRSKAAHCLTQAMNNATESGLTLAECLKKEPESEWVVRWLWAVDRFPYPLWVSFTTYLRRDGRNQRDFERWVWPVLIETMHGSVSARGAPWTLPFNRCKLFVRARSLELSSDIYDREALTRMMAGFYRGLRLGSIGSLCIFFLSSLLFCLDSLFWQVFWWYRGHSVQALGCVTLISLLLLLFNRYELLKIERNFHTLRILESEAVFESYILAQSLMDAHANKVGSEET